MARFVEKAVFGSGVLVGATSQHFAGSLGREQILRELQLVCSGGSHIFVYQVILKICILRLGFVGTLSVRSCSYETSLCRGGGEPACMFSFVGSSCLILFYFLFPL